MNRADIDSAIETLSAADPALAEVIPTLPRCPVFPTKAARVPHFHYIARAIIYQQLAGAAAKAIHDRVFALGKEMKFPRAEEILRLSEEALRGAGLSKSKLKAIRDLAEKTLSGEVKLRGIGRLSNDEVIERLTRVWGVGEWSAQIFLMFRLGRMNVLPGNDLGIQEGIKRLDGRPKRPTPSEVVARGETWQPNRTVAAWYMWRLSDGKG